MRGYWENPEATDAVLRPGPIPGERQLHTGDLFRTDADGFLYFVGRKDDIIKIRGEKVAPKAGRGGAVRLPRRGARPWWSAGPIRSSGWRCMRWSSLPTRSPTEREIIRHCARILHDFMVPKTIEFRAELPKTRKRQGRRGALADPRLRNQS